MVKILGSERLMIKLYNFRHRMRASKNMVSRSSLTNLDFRWMNGHFEINVLIFSSTLSNSELVRNLM